MRWLVFLVLLAAVKCLAVSPLSAGEGIPDQRRHPLAGVFYCTQTLEVFWVAYTPAGFQVWYHSASETDPQSWVRCESVRLDSVELTFTVPATRREMQLRPNDAHANEVGMCLTVSHTYRRIHNHQQVFIDVGTACGLTAFLPDTLPQAIAIFDEWAAQRRIDSEGLAQPVSSQQMPEADKPVLYLYPATPTDIDVYLGLGPESQPLCYPPLDSTQHWRITAQPNGLITHRATGAQYPSLFWEAALDMPQHPDFLMYGWRVDSASLVPFLEARLSEMNFTMAERTEFIQYWLPRMARYPYVQVHFATAGSDSASTNATGRQYAGAAPLGITPAPEHWLRVLMVWHPLEEYHLRATGPGPQTLPRLNRTGYHALEWGGMERFALPDFRHSTHR